MKILINFAIIGFLWVTVTHCAQAAEVDTDKNIIIAADIWCPVNCDPKGEELGIGVDLVKKIFEPLGYKVYYQVMPWSRALEEARAGRIDAVIGGNHTDDERLLLPKHPLQILADDVFVLKDRNLQAQKPDDLKELRLGISAGYGYSAPMTEFLQKQRLKPGFVQEVGGDITTRQNIQKLLAGRVDAVVENRAVMDYTLHKLKLDGQLKSIISITQGPIFIAFSPARSESKQHLQQYDEGIEKLVAIGELKAMYLRYQMTPPD